MFAWAYFERYYGYIALVHLLSLPHIACQSIDTRYDNSYD